MRPIGVLVGPAWMATAFLLAAVTPAAADRYRLVLRPSQATLEPGLRISITCQLYKRRKKQWTWPWEYRFSSDGGVFNGNVYAAPAIPGIYTITARHKSKGVTATSTIHCVPPGGMARASFDPDRIVCEPGQRVPVGVFAFGRDGRRYPLRLHGESVQGGKIEGGFYVAGDREGTFTVTTLVPGNQRCTLAVKIVKVQVARVVLSPRRVKLNPGESVVIRANVFDASEAIVQRQLVWNAAGGTYDPASGKYTAGSAAGAFQLTATDPNSGKWGAATIVIAARRLWLRVFPGHATVEVGSHVHFRPKLVEGDGRGGRRRVFAWPWDFRYECTEGSFYENNFHPPKRPGRYRVWVSCRGLRQSALVDVVQPAARHPVVARLEVRPRKVFLHPGQKVRFKAFAFDGSDNLVAGAPVRWHATGGSITESGEYTAPSHPAAYAVRIADLRGGARAQAVVVVRPLTRYVLRVKPRVIAVDPGQEVTFQLSLERDGQKVWAAPWDFTYSATGGVFRDNVYRASTASGAYVLRFGHKHAQAQAVVHVKAPPLSGIRVVPAQVSMRPGQRVRFVARGYDRFRNQVQFRARWSAEGGSIDDSGTYTAGDAPGRFGVTVTDPATGASAPARVTIVSDDRYVLVVKPAAATVDPGERVAFKAALLKNGKETWSWDWDYTFRAAAGSFANNVYEAPRQPGTYEIVITHPKARAVARVTVRSAQVARLEVVPARAVVAMGKTLQFAAKAANEAGQEVKAKLVWSCTGGTITAEGLFTAGDIPGEGFEVTVTDPASGKTVIAEVNIVVPVSYRVAVHPQRIVLDPGDQVTYRAVLYKNGIGQVTRAEEFTYSATGGSFEDSTYTAPAAPGTYQVTVRHARGTATATLVVRGRQITYIVVSPKNVTLRPGQTLRFTAAAFDRFKSRVAFRVTWKATGGRIDANGLYTAGAQSGEHFEVHAIDEVSGVKAHADVRIRSRGSYYGIGRTWGVQVKDGSKTTDQLTNFIMLSVFYKELSSIDDFRKGFLDGFGRGGGGRYYKSWITVLFEFGRYYGSEYKEGNATAAQVARFISKYVLRLSKRDTDEFKEGFKTGYEHGDGELVYRKILKLAKELKK